ncbi:hypothetical protein TRFO_32763 [Tritrichomonas foetus]|uniref:GRAM domain-containing protein n=1 Tax=Tritrichomonas foetus TaxID=1144522 RepID=A0A1J4JN24_9EUKA|nr:hypothetical protein TRFO_32763 [Tritrichomonas foetus]|eukprot:OHT00527.1 hypothetical protein TRFO_32763 [Tritrichomonas foetus]
MTFSILFKKLSLQKIHKLKMTGNEIPEEIWARWSRPEIEPLRQVVLSFGGSIHKEALIDSFFDVSLLIPDGENTTSLKGIFYLTTRRMVFLPRNMIHPNMVQASFDALRCITGTRSDLTASVVDINGCTAKFQFVSARALYQCFNLFRQLAEASRFSEEKFRSVVHSLATAVRLNETPFNSIEVELQECTQTNIIPAVSVIEDYDDTVDPVTVVLAPVKEFFDYFNNLHFDMHIKLRILLVMSFVSFCLQYIPFLPFCALLIIIYLLYNGWKSLDRDLEEEESKEPNIPAVAGGFVITEKFLMSYLGWRDPRKSILVLQSCLSIILAWLVIPERIYPYACLIAYIYYVIRPLMSSNIVAKIYSGPWFST